MSYPNRNRNAEAEAVWEQHSSQTSTGAVPTATINVSTVSVLGTLSTVSYDDNQPLRRLAASLAFASKANMEKAEKQPDVSFPFLIHRSKNVLVLILFT
jgi:hypothetical protein